MRRRLLSAVLVFAFLAVLAAPLYAFLYDSTRGQDVVDEELFFQVMPDLDEENAELGEVYVPNEVLIKFVCGASESAISNLRVVQGAEELFVGSFNSVRRWGISSSKSVEEWVDFFGIHPLVEYVEPNYVRHAFAFPNDPLYHYQWNFDDDQTNNPSGASSNPYGGENGGGIGMEEAWEVTSGDPSIVVAVLDTGVAYENYAIPIYERNPYLDETVSSYQISPDFIGTSFWVNEDEIAENGLDDDVNGYVDDVNGWDFVNDDAHPNDNNYHGTHVAGTIAQTTDNGVGAAGIAFNTTIMPVKVLDYAGNCTDSSVAEGIYYAVNNGADIINISFGSPDPSVTLEDAVKYAFDSGVVVVAASGNEGVGSVSYPAAYDHYVIAVGATRYDETKASYSNYGSSLNLVAPGGDMDVNQNGDEYVDGIVQVTFKPYQGVHSKADPTAWHYYLLDGTSMAAPHVSGLAALVLSKKPDLTPSQVRNVLESSAEDRGDLGRDDVYGWGLIDAKAALQNIVGSARLLLSVAPFQNAYSGGELLNLTVRVFNELNPPLNSILTLTVAGSGGYYANDSQPIVVEADGVEDFSFSWTVPYSVGTYTLEVGLVPEQLAAYDIAWLEVATSSTGWVEGTVTDFDTDDPMGAVEIFVDENFVVDTDAAGQYFLELLPGEYEITASQSALYYDETASVTVVASEVYTKDFQLKRRSWVLSIGTSGSGETWPAAGMYTCPRGIEFAVEAFPEAGWELSHWLLDSVDVGSNNTIEVLMNVDHFLTAVFDEKTQIQWLRGNVVDAETRAPIEGAEVSVGSRSVFTDATGNYEMEIQAGSYRVVVNEGVHYSQEVLVTIEDSVTVQNFALERSHWMLTVKVEGSGSVNLTQGPHAFLVGSEVVLNAFPEAGWELSHWLLDSVDVGSKKSFSVFMNSDHVLRCVFVEAAVFLEPYSCLFISILVVTLISATLMYNFKRKKNISRK